MGRRERELAAVGSGWGYTEREGTLKEDQEGRGGTGGCWSRERRRGGRREGEVACINRVRLEALGRRRHKAGAMLVAVRKVKERVR